MSEYLSNRDGGKTDEHGFARFVSNLVSGNAISTGWAVSQKAAGANMSIDIAAGTGKIDSGSGYAYEVWSDAIKNVAITTADATNPRRDIAVAYVDKSVVSSASSNNPNAFKFAVVAGTPAGSPSDPSAGTIQAAVGASNPYIQLARISVAAGATSITNAVIADLRTIVSVNANIGGSDGWSLLSYTPTTCTALGNRSYSMVFNGVDLTTSLSAGMRLRTTRTTASPTQSTSLNGTTQYYSKSSPAGMTFTDDFTASAWIKITSYGEATIASRYNGTSGWIFDVDAAGHVRLIGLNGGSANFSYVQSYQSVPLNKWVHVAAQLDMSTFTATTTTSYSMIDGVDVPSLITRGGTNPTALIQAGNLEIGSRNAGTFFFPGKIAQVAIYSAKVTQANVLASISQGLAGTETSLVSAYSFNNSINDLNANANNLTANGSAVATNADSPFGGQADGTISSTLNYAIITKTAFSTNTTVTVQVPEGNAIPTSGSISAVSYSTHKVPYGFPAQKIKWDIEYLCRSQLSTTGTASTWVNVANQLNVPLGEWVLSYEYNIIVSIGGGATFLYLKSTLSTGSTTESDPRFTSITPDISVSLTQTSAYVNRRNAVSLSVATLYYLNLNPSNSSTLVYWDPTGTPVIRAELALL